MYWKTSTNVLAALAMYAFVSALIGASSSQEVTGSNNTVPDTPVSVNSTDDLALNSSIASTESESNLSHILVVTSKSGEPCLLAALNATIRVSYKVLERIVHESYVTTEEIQLPEDVSAQGVCGVNRSHLLLEWGNGTFHLNLTFSLKEPSSAKENSSWSLTAIAVSYDMSNFRVFPGASDATVMTYDKTDLSLFTTELGSAYTCDRDISVMLHSGDDSVHLKFHNIRLAAFGVTSSEFPTATDYCPEKTSSDTPENVLVPLIVACCLSAIVIIIVIGYVINRTIQKRREQSDYRQM